MKRIEKIQYTTVPETRKAIGDFLAKYVDLKNAKPDSIFVKINASYGKAKSADLKAMIESINTMIDRFNAKMQAQADSKAEAEKTAERPAKGASVKPVETAKKEAVKKTTSKPKKAPVSPFKDVIETKTLHLEKTAFNGDLTEGQMIVKFIPWEAIKAGEVLYCRETETNDLLASLEKNPFPDSYDIMKPIASNGRTLVVQSLITDIFTSIHLADGGKMEKKYQLAVYNVSEKQTEKKPVKKTRAKKPVESMND